MCLNALVSVLCGSDFVCAIAAERLFDVKYDFVLGFARAIFSDVSVSLSFFVELKLLPLRTSQRALIMMPLNVVLSSARSYSGAKSELLKTDTRL